MIIDRYVKGRQIIIRERHYFDDCVILKNIRAAYTTIILTRLT